MLQIRPPPDPRADLSASICHLRNDEGDKYLQIHPITTVFVYPKPA